MIFFADGWYRDLPPPFQHHLASVSFTRRVSRDELLPSTRGGEAKERKGGRDSFRQRGTRKLLKMAKQKGLKGIGFQRGVGDTRKFPTLSRSASYGVVLSSHLKVYYSISIFPMFALLCFFWFATFVWFCHVFFC